MRNQPSVTSKVVFLLPDKASLSGRVLSVANRQPVPDRDDALQKLTEDTGDAFATAKAKGSQYFIEQVKQGKDISEAVPALIDTYFSTHQVPAMDPAAEALTRHWLGRGELDDLLKMIAESEYRNSFSKAVQQIAVEGGDLYPAIPVLVRLIVEDEYLIAHAIAAYCGKHPHKRDMFLLDFSQAVLRDTRAREKFFRLCTELQYKGESPAIFLPLLAELVADERWQEKAISTLRWLSRSQSEMAKILPRLLAAMKTAKKDALQSLAYLVGYHYLEAQEQKNFALLLADPRTGVTFGILYACRAVLNNKEFSRIFGEIAGSVLRLMAHADAKVADAALATLENAIEQNAAFRFLEADVKFLEEKKSDLRFAQLSYRLKPDKGTAACSICEKIKRKDTYSSEDSLPKSFQQFTNLGIAAKNNGYSLYRCPECGMYYEYNYDDEWDDMSHFVTISLNRLNTVEAEAAIPDDKKAEHAVDIKKLEELWATRLTHPLLWVRQEAVWVTAEARFFRKEWQNLEVFFRGGKEVRAELKPLFLKYTMLYGDDNELRRLLENKLATDNEDLEHELAKALGQIYVHQKEAKSVMGLLENSSEMWRLAMVQVLWLAARNGYSVAPFAPVLKGLTRDQNTEVRRYARYCIDEAVERGEFDASRDLFGQLLQELKSGDDQRIEDACDGLEKLTEKQSIAEALPVLARLLNNKQVRWHVHRVIRNAMMAGQRIDVAIPALIKLVGKKPYADRADELWTLRDAQEKGHDITAGKPIFLKMLSEYRTQSTAIEILGKMFAKGKITESDLPLMEKLMLKRQHDAYSEAAGYIIFDFCRKKKNSTRMRAMLTHENRNVRGLSCSRMADNSSQIREIGEFLDIFADNMTDKGWYVRVCSGSCLEKYAALGEKERQAVQRLIAKIAENQTNKELAELRTALGK